MRPPQPPDRAAAIVGAVAQHVELDLARVREAVERGLGDPIAGLCWQRAERIAAAALAAWAPGELVEHCERGLAEAHDGFLLTASACLDATADLERNRGDAWIVGAIRALLAFEAAWDVVAETDERPGEDDPAEEAMPVEQPGW